MNLKAIRYIVGQLLQIEGLLMLLPVICAIIYREWGTLPALLLSVGIVMLCGTLLRWKKPRNTTLSPRGGMVIVGISWILMSLFGALPFVFSGLIPNFVDAFFETVSGFTTTGSTVLTATEFARLPEMRGVFFWRAFTHWIGGMGVLVFVLAIIPKAEQKQSRMVYVMQAEMPGPKIDRMMMTVKRTATAMYGIYVAMTLLQTILLMLGGMTFYEALVHAFSTAGTGGFSIWGNSIAELDMGTVTSFTPAQADYLQWVLTIFMFLFSVNFNLYYLMLTGKALHVLFSEELRWFTVIVVGSAAMIVLDVWNNSGLYDSLARCIRDAAFQVTSVISTTGYMGFNFDLWPDFSKMILMLLIFVGGCVGSTGGGLKVGRVIILVKGSYQRIRTSLRHREVHTLRYEKKSLGQDAVNDAMAYVTVYFLIYVVSFFLLTLFDASTLASVYGDESPLMSCFTAVSACINNCGPGLGPVVGPAGNFAPLSLLSKLVLSMDMLLGRLEIFPVLCLFSPSLWKNR